MQREIIHLQAGQCGNQIGTSFWQRIGDEHGIDMNGNLMKVVSEHHNLNVFYNEVNEKKFVPRCISVDLEPGVTDALRNGKFAALFNPNNYISSSSGAGNNWAKGFYTDGNVIIDDIMDIIRREAESCGTLQGFQMSHSLGGGTGSGLGSLIVSRLREEYADKIIQTFSVFPSPRISDVVVEPYNTVLSLHQLVEHTDAVHILDNEGLYDICTDRMQIPHPSYENLNSIISQAMTGVTESLRYPGLLNSDLRKLCVNLVPFPRLHFFLIGRAPLVNPQTAIYNRFTVADCINEVFEKKSIMCACDPRNGRFLTASITFRGASSTKEIDDEMYKFQKKNQSSFVDWIPHNILSSVCNSSATSLTATFIGNSTSVESMFSRILNHYTLMLKRKAYWHWYEGEGMDDLEFSEAGGNLGDLISEYQQNQENYGLNEVDM